MKRRLLAYMLLAMLLGTGGAVFMQPEFVRGNAQAIESVQQFVASKTKTTLSAVAQNDIIEIALALLSGALLLAGLHKAVTNTYPSYNFQFTQASQFNVPDKEKDRRFSRDDVL